MEKAHVSSSVESWTDMGRRGDESKVCGVRKVTVQGS